MPNPSPAEAQAKPVQLCPESVKAPKSLDEVRFDDLGCAKYLTNILVAFGPEALEKYQIDDAAHDRANGLYTSRLSNAQTRAYVCGQKLCKTTVYIEPVRKLGKLVGFNRKGKSKENPSTDK